MPAQILIVDDDPAQRKLLAEAASKLGHRVETLADGRAALERLAAPDGDRFALMILDLVMPELDGMGVLERLAATGRTVPVIVQAAPGGTDMVASAIRAGACDFLVKPVSPERMEVSIANALRLSALEGEVARARRLFAGTLGFSDIVAGSPAMERVVRLGQRAATSLLPILIEGESGVGKEGIARAIHGSGERRSRPFVAVPCGALADDTASSFLFGQEKGARGPAGDRKLGKVLEAHGGTLFLGEIGELPPDAQEKLLRVLQEGEIEPTGSRRAVKVDIRLIAATTRDLIALVKAGRFREDLYYRINVFPIRVPPLRERREDIPALVRHFAARFAAEERKTSLTGVSAESLSLLKRHGWPGNIRQLENAVFRAVVLAEGPQLTPEDFPQIAAQLESCGADLAEAEMPAEPIDIDPPRRLATPPLPPASPPDGSIAALTASGDVRPIGEVEAEMIRLAIRHYRGRMATVARKLGIGRSTLYRKLKELGISEGDDDGQLATE